jgi:hypothetical protein
MELSLVWFGENCTAGASPLRDNMDIIKETEKI